MRWVDAVRNRPVTEIANSRISGSRSLENCCTLIAPRSRPRRHIATKTPISTITAQMSRILNASAAARLSSGKLADVDSENESAIDLLIVRRRLKANPAKR